VRPGVAVATDLTGGRSVVVGAGGAGGGDWETAGAVDAAICGVEVLGTARRGIEADRTRFGRSAVRSGGGMGTRM